MLLLALDQGDDVCGTARDIDGVVGQSALSGRLDVMRVDPDAEQAGAEFVVELEGDGFPLVVLERDDSLAKPLHFQRGRFQPRSQRVETLTDLVEIGHRNRRQPCPKSTLLQPLQPRRDGGDRRQ